VTFDFWSCCSIIFVCLSVLWHCVTCSVWTDLWFCVLRGNVDMLLGNLSWVAAATYFHQPQWAGLDLDVWLQSVSPVWSSAAEQVYPTWPMSSPHQSNMIPAVHQPFWHPWQLACKLPCHCWRSDAKKLWYSLHQCVNWFRQQILSLWWSLPWGYCRLSWYDGSSMLSCCMYSEVASSAG